MTPNSLIPKAAAVEGLSYADARAQMLNPDNLKVITNCYIEPYAAQMKPLTYLQFQRIGYFTPDSDSTPEKPVFNKTVGLKDTWKR